MSLLSLHHLRVAFPGQPPALADVSLELGQGARLGLVGASGSGKSLTALAIMGLLPPRAVQTGTVQGARDGSAMIFQNPQAALNPLRRVGDQIGDVIARHEPLPAAALRARVDEALDQVQIDPARARAYPFELSGGQCQRVGIALALARKPRLLIADEPTTSLDTPTQAAILALIRDLTRARNMALLLITHDLALAAQHCDRIAVMEAGRIIETGPTAQVLTRPAHPAARALRANSPALIARLEEAPAPEPGAVVLRAEGLEKTFAAPRRGLRRPPALPAVAGVTLALHQGEALGLVGASGCGKSTLARMLSGLTRPDAGRVSPLPARAVQMVFQDPLGSLNPRFTAYQCLLDPIRHIHPRRDWPEKVHAAAQAVALAPELLGRFPHQLSGGEAARVAIARAMAAHPRVLILDEPTSALDAPAQAMILRLLERLRRDTGVALVFISHDLHLVRLLCDRALVMDAGRIVEDAPVAQLFAAPRHAQTQALLAALPLLP